MGFIDGLLTSFPLAKIQNHKKWPALIVLQIYIFRSRKSLYISIEQIMCFIMVNDTVEIIDLKAKV